MLLCIPAFSRFRCIQCLQALQILIFLLSLCRSLPEKCLRFFGTAAFQCAIADFALQKFIIVKLCSPLSSIKGFLFCSRSAG